MDLSRIIEIPQAQGMAETAAAVQQQPVIDIIDLTEAPSPDVLSSDNRKRKSLPGNVSTEVSKKPKTEAASREIEQPVHDQQVEHVKIRLTTPDIEFDYDYSQLRDPRPTPGRERRPRYSESDIPPELKASLNATRYIPEPEKPTGRLNRIQKDEVFRAKSRLNPMASFYDLYKCHDKGREGAPTHDTAGFQLDWVKVDKWMKPQAYNKKKMVRGMEKRLNKDAQERKEMFKLFFTDIQGLDYAYGHGNIELYLKDHVAKDLGIPWHQIGPQQVWMWRNMGFQPVKYEEWWKEPTEMEKKRMMKMLSGASLRKDFSEVRGYNTQM